MSKNQHRLNTLMFFGLLLVGLAALVAALAPRFDPYTPKDALIEHTEVQQEDSPETIAQLNACYKAGMERCDWDGDEVIGYPPMASTAPYEPVPTAVPAPPKASLTETTESRDQRSTQPAPPLNGGTVPDASVPSTTSTNDCTTHGDPFAPECTQGVQP